MTGSMVYYHGPCEDDLEMATGGNQLEKVTRFSFINKFLRNAISAESNNRYTFVALHPHFSNDHDFIKKKLVEALILSAY